MAPELLFVHGMGGSPADWEEVRARLGGRSLPVPASAADPLSAAEALAKEIPANAVLCGYSLGGRLSLLTARTLRTAGRPLRGLVLASAGLGFAQPAEREARNGVDRDWARLAREDAAHFWARWYEQSLFASFRALPPARRSAWLESRKSIQIEHLSSQLERLGPGRHEPLAPVLREEAANGLQVLYIVGELDEKYVELSRKVQSIPGVQVIALPGAGHILPLEAPAALASALKDFLHRLEGA